MNKYFLVFIIILSNLCFSEENLDTADAPKTILFWNTAQKLDGFKNYKEILPTRLVSKSVQPYPLTYNLVDLSNLTYTYKNRKFSIYDFIENFKVAGLIVVRDGVILHEDYNFGNSESTQWISFSVTKSVTSMLIGAAIQDGFIKSVEDRVTTYLPQLMNSKYKDVSIKDVLHMSSGIDWNEDYTDPSSDVNIAGAMNSLSLYQYLDTLNSVASPGTKFNYNTGETNLLGGIVRSAIGNNLSSYLEQKIWKPFGMEFDAYWAIDSDFEQELGGCCLNATLRDYARIGIFAMENGVLPNGTRILPKNWMLDSTTPSKNYSYYGYQWWLDGSNYKSYYADGIFGQFIWIDPVSRTVVAMHGARDLADVDSYVGGHRLNFMVALLQAINK
mgnify:FL=1